MSDVVPPPPPGEDSPTRASLLHRLKDWEDQQSWREFFEAYWRLIYGAALKAGFNPPDAEDLVQDVVLSVAKKMPEFTYDPALGSFKAWLLVVTRSRIADQLRKQGRQVPVAQLEAATGTGTGPLARLADSARDPLEAVWNAEWQSNLAAVALDRVKRKVKARDFQVYHLAVVQQTPPRDVATALGVNIAQVYLIKHRVSRFVQAELRHLEATHS